MFLNAYLLKFWTNHAKSTDYRDWLKLLEKKNSVQRFGTFFSKVPTVSVSVLKKYRGTLFSCMLCNLLLKASCCTVFFDLSSSFKLYVMQSYDVDRYLHLHMAELSVPRKTSMVRNVSWSVLPDSTWSGPLLGHARKVGNGAASNLRVNVSAIAVKTCIKEFAISFLNLKERSNFFLIGSKCQWLTKCWL